MGGMKEIVDRVENKARGCEIQLLGLESTSKESHLSSSHLLGRFSLKAAWSCRPHHSAEQCDFPADFLQASCFPFPKMFTRLVSLSEGKSLENLW
ncbi:hypothetical protein C1H46_028999 [Malus baccata]|uniref:Uncharacterized protein n=1 Tax=Malus baccata TaxID=106549 RepID=A0A540LGJ8_MALBA|nr:hypothetical protein C1H46_028999 [Malus baccata]